MAKNLNPDNQVAIMLCASFGVCISVGILLHTLTILSSAASTGMGIAAGLLTFALFAYVFGE